MLTLAVAAVGITTVVPQLLLPMAAGMVEDERRGAVSGMLLSGLLGGILLARTFSATLGGWLGWRAPFLISAGLILVLAGVLLRLLPDTTPTSRQHYGALLAAPLRLLAAEPALRRSCLNQALMFGAFSAAWTTVALLVTGPAFGLSTQAVGVLALVGAGSVLSTPFAGRRIDKVGPEPVSLVCFAGVLASAGVLLLADLHGAAGLILLGAGMLLLARSPSAARSPTRPGYSRWRARPGPGSTRVHDQRVHRRQHRLLARRAGVRRTGLARDIRAGRRGRPGGAGPARALPAGPDQPPARACVR